jgi:periodic tryptophan protein 1
VKPQKPLWTLAAHDGSISALDINVHVRGCFVTGGVDKSIKIWNLTEKDGKRDIGLVTSRDLGVVRIVFSYFSFLAIPMGIFMFDFFFQGKVFSASFCPDDPTTLAVGGSQGSLQLWDSATNAGVRKAFGARLSELGKDASHKDSDGLVRLADDDDEDEDEDDE